MTTDDLMLLFDGNRSLAARELNVQRQTIINWTKRKKLTPLAWQKVQAWFKANGKRVPKEWMP